MSALFDPRKDNVVELTSRERPGRKQLVEQLFERHAKALRLFLRGRSVPRDRVEDLLDAVRALPDVIQISVFEA